MTTDFRARWRTSVLGTLQGEGVRKVTQAMKRLRMEVLDEAHLETI